MKSKGAIMKTSGKIELGRRRAVRELPAELANLHHKVSIGSSCFLKLAPRPSKHWDARRAAEMAVGAGFTLDKPCFFRSQIAFLSVTKIESLPESVGPEMHSFITEEVLQTSYAGRLDALRRSIHPSSAVVSSGSKA